MFDDTHTHILFSNKRYAARVRRVKRNICVGDDSENLLPPETASTRRTVRIYARWCRMPGRDVQGDSGHTSTDKEMRIYIYICVVPGVLDKGEGIRPRSPDQMSESY